MIDVILYVVLGIAVLMVLRFVLKAFLIGIVISLMIKKSTIERKLKEQQV